MTSPVWLETEISALMPDAATTTNSEDPTSETNLEQTTRRFMPPLGDENVLQRLNAASRKGPRGFLQELAELDSGVARTGVYTCMRTSKNHMQALRESGNASGGPCASAVLKLELHVSRLTQGLSKMAPLAQPLESFHVMFGLQKVLEDYGRQLPEEDRDALNAAVLVTIASFIPEGKSVPRMFVHAMNGPPISPMVELAVLTRERTAQGNRQGGKPLVKSISWISERAPIEQKESMTGVSEIIMLDKDGGDAVLEGLVSNVFVVTKDGTVRTACADVLPGCTREMVIDKCRALDIPLCLQAPLLSEVDSWASVFLTNANKPVVEVRRIRLPDELATLQLPGHEVTKRLFEAVSEEF
mmetsp:Transcript_4939/g.10260  ORF Transcript_4939/g.10260 Transcript_4939/m.10260 type:complete len:357 (-) Transcript_4939:352-1422(-)